MGTQLGTQNDRKQLHIVESDTTSSIEGGGGRSWPASSSSLMDKTVWKIFTKGTVAEYAKVFIGFTLAPAHDLPIGGRFSNLG